MVQVLLNLCTNAWHAMESHGGKLTLKLMPATRNGKEMIALEDAGIAMMKMLNREAIGKIVIGIGE